MWTCTFEGAPHTAQPADIKGNISIAFANRWSIIQKPLSSWRVPGFLRHMVAVCVCTVCVCSGVTSLCLVIKLLITEACMLWCPHRKTTKGTTKLNLFFRTWLLLLPCPDHITSNDEASNASYNSQHSNLLCKSTRWLSVYRAPFISSKPGFASIQAVVISVARSFGNLSSMSWLSKGLLFHSHHPPTPLISSSEVEILIKWLVSFMQVHHKNLISAQLLLPVFAL